MNLRIADLFDIALIAVFVYSAIIWFRRTASKRVVIGICLLGGVYLLAKFFDLYLTLLLFQTVFAVLLIALVVVFQEEIRRAFERVAVWGTFRDRRRYAGFQGMDALIEGVSNLSANQVGALIVIRGTEPLDRHAEGGIPLYGRVSKPLLYSIFDPHSPGHDGAVLIEGEKVTKFGAHLPLSKNLSQVGTMGTRHTAALGMSECCDAFVIVVSEETGTIRMTRDGRMEVMSSAAELKGRLERFYHEKFPRKGEPDWKRFLREDARLKALALLLAVLAWFMYAYRPERVQRTFAVPIEYRNLPEGWTLEGAKMPEAMVTLSGPQREFNLLNSSSLVLSVDLSGAEEGQQRFSITEQNLRRPPNLAVHRIEPNRIPVEAHRLAVVGVPVEARTSGKLPPGLRLLSVKALPASVRVRVRAADLKGFDRLETEPVDLSGVTQSVSRRVRLLLPEHCQLLEPDSPEVRVTVEVAPDPAPPEGKR